MRPRTEGEGRPPCGLGVQLMEEFELHPAEPDGRCGADPVVRAEHREGQLDLRPREHPPRELRGDREVRGAAAYTLPGEGGRLQLEGTPFDDEGVLDAERTPAIGVVEVGLGGEGRRAQGDGAEERSGDPARRTHREVSCHENRPEGPRWGTAPDAR